MYRNKKDVDQHVESLISRLSSKEFSSRGYSIGRLYYEVGDYSSCRRYVEQYVNQNNNNAAAHALLGQALQKLGQKEKALEEYKTSFSICPSQNSLVLNICEILADGELDIDPGRAKYWCDKAEAMFPKHPVTYQLREKLLSIANPDPEALANLLTEELAIRPKDVLLHIRLLQFYLKNNKIQEAFTHSCNVEFGETNFIHNFEWYKTLAQILKCNPSNPDDWLFQLLLLTVTERMCVLSLTENQGIIETTQLLHVYDQAIERVAKAGSESSYTEFHTCLLQHHRSQFAFLAATFLLVRGEDHNWGEATRDAESLMLIAWHSPPFDPALKWVTTAPKIQQNAARRWYCEGSYRCSQSGHFLLANINDKGQSFLDRISLFFSGTQWKTKLYGKIFSSRYHLDKIKTSNLISSLFSAPTLRLPKRSEVEQYDEEAQRAYGNSLHHFVWILLNYRDYSQFKCTTFEMLPISVQNDKNCGPESLCQLDVYAFLYCATLVSYQTRSNQEPHKLLHKPKTLPASITELLCTLPQMKWWDCAYKFCRNELGTEMTDIRATLSRGIEIVRCIDNHGLNPELLCQLGRIFDKRAKHTMEVDEKRNWEMRAFLYFSSAIPLFERTRTEISKSDKPLFDYTNNHLLPREFQSLLEECKLYVALHQLNDGEHEKAVKLLTNLKSPQALYYLGVTYKKMAMDENNYCQNSLNDESKYITLLSKAQSYGYEALYKLKDPENKSNHLLSMETEELLREIEILLNKTNCVSANQENKNSSDEYISLQGNEDVLLKSQSLFLRNFSSTPKRISNVSNYRTPVASQIIENRTDQQCFERIESQISSLQKRDATMTDFIELTKSMFAENRDLGNQIISTMNSNMKSTTDQFALLKISVDQVKDQIDECRNECKDVGELKKQIAEMKKDINKLKKASSEQAIVENELFNLDEEYRANDNATTFAAQLPFAAQQVMPPFNQRIMPPFTVPPNPFQLYGQNLFNLYNQYSQFSQPQTVPGAPPMFDAARSQVNYPGVFPTPDQMYLDVANLVQQTMPTAPSVPVVPATVSVPASMVAPSLPVVSLPHATAPTTVTSLTHSVEAKEVSRSLPANVVITSSDPLPTCTSAPTPVLSVTIPAKHIKNIPHNYQIQMPTAEPAPVFGFPTLGNKINTTSASSNWDKTTVFKDTFLSSNTSGVAASKISFSPNRSNTNVVDEAGNAANDIHNKSRTLSERSNTSVDNYDPCPDFKPIIPLPAEVKVTTGEEDETVIFSARAKLYRFTDNQWKERGLGEMKLLKHNVTGKVRVLMRREQIHKICANHIITPEMEIKPMKNEAKAYFWVANDFADETLVLEKFSVRFKTADIARQFYDAFETARLETANVKIPEITKTVDSPKLTQANDLQPAKTVFGGFTFSSTPAFKPVDDNKPLGKQIEAVSSPKVNIFSGLNFKTGPSSSPFSNLFTTPTNQISSNQGPDEKANSSNVSDSADHYEPTAEFEPVVPLPALVDTKTGEEDEIVLFEHRAKLLRFVASSKEWKERGLGNMKILVNKDNVQKLRLLMRREQVMKVCCNHAITKTMSFQKMPQMDKAVTWCAQDYAEGELTPETFCLRFKTIQACDDFISAIKVAQSKLKDESKAAKEEQNAAKQNSIFDDTNTTANPISSNWGDKFKPKQGSWECKECFVRNDQSVESCNACKNPRNPSVGTTEPKSSDVKNEIKFSFGFQSQISDGTKTKELSKSDTLTGWGDKFKPKQGSWECEACLVRNEPTVEICTACNSSKHPGGAKPESKGAPKSEMKFKFGIPNQSTEDHVPKVPIKSTWGDMYKPPAGTWECKLCFVRNESNVENCCACNSPKDPSVISKPVSTWSGSKFNFGIPPTQSGDLKRNDTTSIFDGTGIHKFNFGIPSNTQGQSNNTFLKEDKTSSLNHSLKPGNEGSINNSKQITESKPALLPTPQKTSENATFDFVFKPKTTSKDKSPINSPRNEKGNESDGNEYASDDEGHHIQITPIVPLPEKVKVVTGEEDEEELFGHRAKLLIFVSGEWKERGIGVVKILKHKLTAKLRVVMRREQIFKICLNHALTSDIIYNLKDEKNWIFAANDFSEGELSLQRFCLKFKTKEIALQFKDAIDLARKGITHLVNNKQNVENKQNVDSEEVEFITETQSNSEEKKKAKDLMLPENFYLYKDKIPCPGCRGCKDDNDAKPVDTDKKNTGQSPFVSKPFCTPDFANDSVYLTPNFANNSVYSTPELTKATIVPPSLSEKDVNSDKDLTKKDKNIIQKPKLFSVDTQSSIFKPPVFGVPSTTTPINQPTIINNENQNTDPKSIFAAANLGVPANNSIFSGFKPSTNNMPEEKSIFGTALTSKSNAEKKPDVNTIFGGETGQTQFNLFGSQTQRSIFDAGTVNNPSLPSLTNMFGSSNVSNLFNNGSIWSVNSNTDFKTTNEEAKPKNDLSTAATVLGSGEVLTFDAFKKKPELKFQSNPDFKWEGAGQQIFAKTEKGKTEKQKGNDTGSDNEGDAGNGGDEEYDPHYEPIVPLPDKIIVTTGEEDEEKLFGTRCKLFRYNDSTREWKERGVGELKILYHPEKKTYRLLFRREQVYKAVLNMLLHADLELLPMKKTDRAWTWAGRNYAESPAGEQETLAVRFSNQSLAEQFHDKVKDCVRDLVQGSSGSLPPSCSLILPLKSSAYTVVYRSGEQEQPVKLQAQEKLQAAAAQAIREEQEKAKEIDDQPKSLAHLRLPKHLQDSARADNDLAMNPANYSQATSKAHEPAEPFKDLTSEPGVAKRVLFQDVEEEDAENEDAENYEQMYYQGDDYVTYYNEEEESGVYFSCDCEASVSVNTAETFCAQAHVQVLFDHGVCAHKILVTNAATGELLADMLLHDDTEFQLTEDTCSWSGTNYASNNDASETTVTVNFPDSETAMQFYDCCESSKGQNLTGEPEP